MTSFALTEEADSWRALNVASGLQEQGCYVAVQQYVRTLPMASTPDWGGRFGEVTLKIDVAARSACLARHVNSVVRGRYDVVIGNNINGALLSILGRLAAPLILDMHGDMAAELSMEEPDQNGAARLRRLMRMSLYKLAEVVTCRLSSRIWCVSHTMMSVLAGRGIRSEKLVYTPNGVDLAFFSPAPREGAESMRSRLGISRSSFLIGYLGRFHRWQGVETLLEATRSIEDPEVEFLIVGGGETKRERNVCFVSKVPLENMPLYYAVCDVLVLPRPHHPATEVAAPTKFAEYAAMGKPILLTNVGDAANHVRKYGCGVIVDDNNPAQLRLGFAQMKRCSGEKLLEMGKAARRLAEREFDFEDTKRTMVRCIAELAGER